MKRLRNRLPAAVAILAVLAAVVILGGRYISNEYHTYYSDKVREYETISSEYGTWVLNSERKELLGRVYAAFTVSDKESGDLIYRCPDLYPVSDLISISWEETTGDILVETSDRGVIRYLSRGREWKKENP